MTIARFDPFSGASGDMVLGTLIDAGLDESHLEAELANLPLSGYWLTVEHIEKNAVRGVRLTVDADEEPRHRTWHNIRAMITESTLPERVKAVSLAIFGNLAEAEAAAHGVAIDDVHFHEVGAVDSIVDICGTAIGLHALGITAATCGPVRVGSGFVMSQHGLLPVPAPATAQLIARSGMPIAPLPSNHAELEAELLTPTGAAILATICDFTPSAASFTRVAYGFGRKELPWPNALRLWLDDRESHVDEIDDQEDGLLVLETNIDDMSPQGYELLIERLFAAGALDVWMTPIQMKKSRPGTQLSVLARAEHRPVLESMIFGNSPTLGVRSHSVQRTALERLETIVATRFGDVRLKLAVRDDRISQARPEYDDCARLARQTGRSFADVWDDAYRIGESLVGRHPGTIETQ